MDAGRTCLQKVAAPVGDLCRYCKLSLRVCSNDAKQRADVACRLNAVVDQTVNVVLKGDAAFRVADRKCVLVRLRFRNKV